jgi:hypothetical protein
VKNKAILRIIATTFKSELFIGNIPLSLYDIIINSNRLP